MPNHNDDPSPWHPIATMPDGTTAITRINDAKGIRNESILRKSGGRFFTNGPAALYVYYTPTEWRGL